MKERGKGRSVSFARPIMGKKTIQGVVEHLVHPVLLLQTTSDIDHQA